LTAALRWLGARGTWILFISILIALFAQPLSSLARPLLPLAVFVMLTTAMVRVDPSTLRAILSRPAKPVLAVTWLLVATPLLIALVMALTGVMTAHPVLALSILVFATAPPVIASPAISSLVGLNPALSLITLLPSTLLIPLTVPAIMGLVIDQTLPLTMVALMQRLALLILGAALAATVLRRLLGAARIQAAQTEIDGINVIAMTLFAVAIMDGMLALAIARPLKVLAFTGLAFALNFAMALIATGLFWRAGTRDAATLGYSAGFRNMALTVTALGAAVPADTWLLFVVAQFPIYMSPLLLRPVYGRMLAQAPRAG